MHPSQLFALFAISVTLFNVAPAFAVPARNTGKPRYQQMKPFEDLSIQEDAIEVYDKAVSAFSHQRYDEAEKLFKKVLQMTPKNADAKYNLGAIAEWHNDLDKALKYYVEALSLKPTDRDFVKAVSDVQIKMKIDQEAKENKRQENLVEAGQRARMAFSNGDYYEAARQLNQLVRVFPNEPKVHYALGQSLRALRVYEWSAYHLKMAIYLDPTDETYHKALIDLDQEIQIAQEQAINDSARIAMGHLHPLSGGELTTFGGEFR
jgi:tetratricopeptide (TPR) repeat protein